MLYPVEDVPAPVSSADLDRAVSSAHTVLAGLDLQIAEARKRLDALEMARVTFLASLHSVGE